MNILRIVLILVIFLTVGCVESTIITSSTTTIPYVIGTLELKMSLPYLPKGVPDFMTLNKKSQRQISPSLCFLAGEDDTGNAYALIYLCKEPLFLGFIRNTLGCEGSEFYIFDEHGKAPVAVTLKEFDEFLGRYDSTYKNILDNQKREKNKIEKKVVMKWGKHTYNYWSHSSNLPSRE